MYGLHILQWYYKQYPAAGVAHRLPAGPPAPRAPRPGPEAGHRVRVTHGRRTGRRFTGRRSTPGRCARLWRRAVPKESVTARPHHDSVSLALRPSGPAQRQHEGGRARHHHDRARRAVQGLRAVRDEARVLTHVEDRDAHVPRARVGPLRRPGRRLEAVPDAAPLRHGRPAARVARRVPQAGRGGQLPSAPGSSGTSGSGRRDDAQLRGLHGVVDYEWW